jgi:Holliday junction resolvasome RuvABC endonuclease subunit
MRSAGIDIASTGWSAITLVVDSRPVKAVAWKPEANLAEAIRFDEYYKWIRFQLGIMKPFVVSVERTMFAGNKKVVQELHYHESIAILAAKRSGAMVVHPGASTVRKIVFGNGRMKKEDAWKAIQKRYPNFEFGKVSEGAKDKGDALGHALAAPIILERK